MFKTNIKFILCYIQLIFHCLKYVFRGDHRIINYLYYKSSDNHKINLLRKFYCTCGYKREVNNLSAEDLTKKAEGKSNADFEKEAINKFVNKNDLSTPFKIDKLGWYENILGIKYKAIHKMNCQNQNEYEYIFVNELNNELAIYSEAGIDLTYREDKNPLIKYLGPDLPKEPISDVKIKDRSP